MRREDDDVLDLRDRRGQDVWAGEEADDSWTIRLDPPDDAVPYARSAVAVVAAGAGADAAGTSASVLLAGELVADAVAHGRPPCDLVVRTAEGRYLRVEVHDLRTDDAADGSPGALGTVEAIADRWGRTVSDRGTAVWFEVPLRQERTGPAPVAAAGAGPGARSAGR